MLLLRTAWSEMESAAACVLVGSGASGERSDDTHDIVLNRWGPCGKLAAKPSHPACLSRAFSLEQYERETRPVAELYRAEGKLVEAWLQPPDGMPTLTPRSERRWTATDRAMRCTRVFERLWSRSTRG